MDTPRVRLGELLVRAGLISGEQLEDALGEQRRVGKKLGSVLVDSGLVSETQVTQILSQQLSVPWVSLHHIDFSTSLLELVPLDLVRTYCLIPIYVRRVRGLGDALYVAMDDPTNAQALTLVAERSGLHVRAMIAPPSDIRAAIRTYYGVGEEPARPPRRDQAADEDVSTGVHQRPDDLDDVPTGIHDRATLNSAPVQALPPPPGPPSQPDLDAAVDDLVSEKPAVPEVAVPAAPAASSPVASAPTRSSPVAAPPPAPASSPVAASKEDAPPSSRSTRDFNPTKPAGERARTVPAKPGARRMIALTLLDGTTIRVPAKGKGATEPEPEPEPEPAEAAEPAVHTSGDQVSARDVVAALRAAVHGVDPSETLGQSVRWESVFAALLSALLKKRLITDAEFIEELKKS